MRRGNTNSLTVILNFKKGLFLYVFFVTFLLSYAFLAWVDFLPEPVTAKSVNLESVATQLENDIKSSDLDAVATSTGELSVVLPEKITFNTMNRSVSVSNPTSRKVADLDKALLSGVVRHPDSAALGQAGTVFILGHSSYLPKVINSNFQAFNGIQNLKWGDTVSLEADSKIYIYRVDRVYKAKATDTTVPIAGQEKRLILATCNSFGSTDDRFIVEADFLEVKVI
jgi:LPXTG-site transpeptidase (sortase) family protein